MTRLKEPACIYLRHCCKTFYYIFSSFLMLTVSIHISYSQQVSPSVKFDSLIGLENTDLSIGVEYIEYHNIRNNKHKYFLSEKYYAGTVVYDGQEFNGVSMKYNVFDDLLVVQIDNFRGSSTFQLFKDKVKEFSLADHRFMNIGSENQNHKTEGFHQVLLETPKGILLKKHLKKKRRRLDRSSTYYEFTQNTPKYGFYKDSHYFLLSSRREVQKLFPDKVKTIRHYYRAHRNLREKDPDRFLIGLFDNLAQYSPNHKISEP